MLLFMLSLPGLAQTPHKGEAYQVTSIDLDGDGRPEKVGLRCTDTKESGWSSRLTVWDAQGKIRWQSMPSRVGVWAFGGWDWGISDLQLVADIDGDGQIEALSPAPASDVRPVTFRIYRWTGRSFEHVRNGTLLARSEEEFSWGNSDQGNRWIGAFRKGLTATIWSNSADGQSLTREALVEPTATGFRVKKWRNP